MDYFESNFKDRSNEAPKDLPKGFEWDAMKDGIEAKMRAQRPNRPNRWWPLLLLLLISGCGGWLVFSLIDNKVDQQVILNDNNDPSLDTFAAESNDNNNEYKTKNTSLNENSTTPLTGAEILNNPIQHSKNDPLLTKDKQIFDPLSGGENIIGESKDSRGTAINYSQESNTVESELVTTGELRSTSGLSRDKSLTRPLALLPVTIKPLEKVGQYTLKTIKQESIVNPHPDKQIAFTILGGVNNWKINSSYGPNNSTIEGFPGLSIRPEISLRKRKWLFSIAYQYDRLQEKFEYAGSTTVQEEKEDVVVGEVVNSLTGEVIEHTLKDTLVNVTYTQRELKYNTYNFHQLELGVARQIMIKQRHELYARGGLTYLFLFDGSGKRLNEQKLVDEFDVEKSLGRSSEFALSFGLEYSYRISSKTRLMARFYGQQYLTAIDLIGTETIRPFAYGIQWGIQSRF